MAKLINTGIEVLCPLCNTYLTLTVASPETPFEFALLHHASGCEFSGRRFKLPTVELEEVGNAVRV